MNKKIIVLKNLRFEVLTDRHTFVGLGRVWIGQTLVRSGRLPLRPYAQTFSGLELADLRLLRIRGGRIELEAQFRPLPVKLMRDHSFDPIHDLGDWNKARVVGQGRLDLVLEPARDEFNGVKFAGFAYHWEYRSGDVPLFWLMDQASWELDGNVTGATVYSQSACSAPVVKFDRRNSWSTEGVLYFDGGASNQNPVMTHNLARWASHGSFDFQFKGDRTLIGVFERVELIRSVLVRDAGAAELKTFDKHIFDQTKRYRTSAKRILLNTAPKSETAQQNVWTWILDEVDTRARGEFGIKLTPTVPMLSQNFWKRFTVERYYKDLVPAAINLGVKRLFVDNLKKSAMTENATIPNTNMCCGHEYEIAESLGGVKRVKAFVDDCAKHGIQVMCWTNNDQSLSSPINDWQHVADGWYVQMEDTRQRYGGAYTAALTALDFSSPDAWKYFVKSHVKVHRETGLHFFFDSFYNLGFMPVSYRHCAPRTMWRGCATAFKALNKAGIEMLIESFGPWGQPLHGHPSAYNYSTMFACYRVGTGDDYTSVPTKRALKDMRPKSAAGVYYALAHMAYTGILLFEDGKRIDQVWTDGHRRALADYHAVLPDLHQRILQEDGLAVLWQNKSGRRGTLFNFKKRRVTLSGSVTDITTGRALPKADSYALEAQHTYRIDRRSRTR